MKNFEQARTLDFCNLKSVLYRGCGRIHVRQDNTQVGELADNGSLSALLCGWGISRNRPSEVVAVLAFHHWRACRPL